MKHTNDQAITSLAILMSDNLSGNVRQLNHDLALFDAMGHIRASTVQRVRQLMRSDSCGSQSHFEMCAFKIRIDDLLHAELRWIIRGD